MKQANKLAFLLFLFLLQNGKAQPYVDIANFNYQNFSAVNKKNPALENKTEIYSLGVFLPKELKNGNTLLFRINSESIKSSITPRIDEVATISSISIALGYQWLSKNKKWKSVLMGIPKVASDFKSAIRCRDFQYGFLFIQNYKWSSNLQLKAGLYYNKEAFGDFFVPLVGVDWKASDRWQFFGILPTNYRIEYAIAKKKWFTGVNFKAFTRSFQLSTAQKSDYVRFDEVVLKGFLEYQCFKNAVLFAELGRSFGKSPLQYEHTSNAQSFASPIYAPIENYSLFSLGFAYRIRNE